MFKTSVFPVPPGAERKVTLRYTQLCRKTSGLTDFLVPAEHGQVHVAAGRRSRSSTWRSTAAPTSRTSTARRIASKSSGPTTSTPSSPTRPRIRFRRPIFACSTTSAAARSAASVLSYRPRQQRGRLFPAAGQPRDQAGRRRAAEEDGGVRGRSLGQHERRKNRAGQGGLEVRAQQSARRRPVQHHRLRQRSGKLPAGVAAVRRRNPQSGAWALSKASMPAAARTSTGRLKTALAQLTRRQPAEFRDLPDRRPAHRRRAERSQDRRPTRRATTRCAPGFSRSAWATT